MYELCKTLPYERKLPCGEKQYCISRLRKAGAAATAKADGQLTFSLDLWNTVTSSLMHARRLSQVNDAKVPTKQQQKDADLCEAVRWCR